LPCRLGGGTTLWRWLHEEAIRPWQHRCWIFPRDPDFARKAGQILDLYQRQWQGQGLKEDEFVVSTDEKTSIQARRRLHATVPPGPKRPMKVEHEYQRKGAWTYLAAWDVHRARLFGRCEAKSGIAPFDRLVAQVMSQFRAPLRSDGETLRVEVHPKRPRPTHAAPRPTLTNRECTGRLRIRGRIYETTH